MFLHNPFQTSHNAAIISFDLMKRFTGQWRSTSGSHLLTPNLSIVRYHSPICVLNPCPFLYLQHMAESGVHVDWSGQLVMHP